MATIIKPGDQHELRLCEDCGRTSAWAAAREHPWHRKLCLFCGSARISRCTEEAKDHV